MGTNRVDAIIQYALAVASESDDFRDRELGPIHIIKYLYLADLAYAEMNGGQTYTGLPWYFFRFGPWVDRIQDAIPPAVAAIGGSLRTYPYDNYKEIKRWNVTDPRIRSQLERDLDPMVAASVSRFVKEFGSDTDRLLHYVYGTAPMRLAAPKEILDFSSAVRPKRIKEEQVVDENPMTVKQTKKLDAWRKETRAGLLDRLEAKRGGSANYIAPAPPRYDDVFLSGLASLDEQAGEPISPGKIRCSISTEMWKSSARYDPEIP